MKSHLAFYCDDCGKALNLKASLTIGLMSWRTCDRCHRDVDCSHERWWYVWVLE